MKKLRLLLAVACLLMAWQSSPVEGKTSAGGGVTACNCRIGTDYGVIRFGNCDINYACQIPSNDTNVKDY